MRRNAILKWCLIRHRENENIQPEGETSVMKNLVSCFSLKYNFSQTDLICTLAFVMLSLFCNHTILLSLMRKYCKCFCLILHLCYGSPLFSPAWNGKKSAPHLRHSTRGLMLTVCFVTLALEKAYKSFINRLISTAWFTSADFTLLLVSRSISISCRANEFAQICMLMKLPWLSVLSTSNQSLLLLEEY